jgi:hypothetical protein
VRFPQFTAITLLALMWPLASAHAETRIALVTSNGAYKSLPALKNPPNPFAEALRQRVALQCRQV